MESDRSQSWPNKLIINFTPTGMLPTKKMTPHIPTTPQEVIDQVLEARKYGVSMVHLHARGEDGRPTHKKEVYAQIVRGIRQVDGWGDSALVLCVSTSGRLWRDFRRRSEVLELSGDARPDMASLTLSSLNFNRQASINSPEMIQRLARKMRDNGIKPELEAFDIGMINYAQYLHRKGFIDSPFYFNLILGNVACAQANILNLGLMVNDLPERSIWSVGGVGDAQLMMNVNGMINGGGVRVGLEDNVWWTPRRQRLATNLDLLSRIHTIATTLEIEIASPRDVRALLELQGAGPWEGREQRDGQLTGA
jgi:3-keto-5-aminohexanoate cleavage enzyme